MTGVVCEDCGGSVDFELATRRARIERFAFECRECGAVGVMHEPEWEVVA